MVFCINQIFFLKGYPQRICICYTNKRKKTEYDRSQLAATLYLTRSLAQVNHATKTIIDPTHCGKKKSWRRCETFQWPICRPKHIHLKKKHKKTSENTPPELFHQPNEKKIKKTQKEKKNKTNLKKIKKGILSRIRT